MLEIHIDQLLIQVVNFLILIFVLNKILYRPIRNVLLQRKEKIQGLERDVNGAVSSANEKGAAFANGIKDARQLGIQKKNSIIENAMTEEKEIIQRINEQAQADLSAFKQKIAETTESVKSALMKEVESISREIGKKILGRAV